LQKAYAAVDFSESFFSVNVVAILGPVTIEGSGMNDRRDLRSLDLPELM
jgi:hypothetical protein